MQFVAPGTGIKKNMAAGCGNGNEKLLPPARSLAWFLQLVNPTRGQNEIKNCACWALTKKKIVRYIYYIFQTVEREREGGGQQAVLLNRHKIYKLLLLRHNKFQFA